MWLPTKFSKAGCIKLELESVLERIQKRGLGGRWAHSVEGGRGSGILDNAATLAALPACICETYADVIFVCCVAGLIWSHYKKVVHGCNPRYCKHSLRSLDTQK